MAAIAITITTTSAQIFDPNGRNGWGTATIRPSQPFVYTSAAVVYTVTGAATVIGIADGIIDTVDGVSATTFTLSPTTSNSNVPTEVYYIVDIDVNGTTQRKYWVLDYTSNTSVEWGSVALLPTADSGSDDVATGIVNGTTNLPQYLLRSDTVDAATIGTASDGRGYVPRLDSSTGKITTDEVGTASITALAVTTAKIAADAVTTAKILDANVTLAKMANIAADTVIGRANGAGTGVPTALTTTQLAAMGVTVWAAGYDIDVGGAAVSLNGDALQNQRKGNTRIAGTPHATEFAVEYISTGTFKIHLPTGHTTASYTLIVLMRAGGRVYRVTDNAGASWNIIIQVSSTGALDDSDFSFTVLRVA